VRREAERVPAEAGAARSKRNALSARVCGLADADSVIGFDSGTGVNSPLIDLGGLGEFCLAGVADFEGIFILILPRGGLNDVDLAILVGRLLGDALLFLSRFTTGVWAFVFLDEALLFLLRFTTGVWAFVFLVGDALLFLLRFSAASLAATRASRPTLALASAAALAALLAAAAAASSRIVRALVSCPFLIRSFAAFSRNICFCLCLSWNRNFL